MFPTSSGELLRKKRREKDGHKDPLLQEISRLQEEVMTQISNLRKEHEAAEKKRSEIDKVALILGLSPSDRPRRLSKQADQKEEEPPPPQKKKREPERSPERQQMTSKSTPTVQTPADTPSKWQTSFIETPSCIPFLEALKIVKFGDVTGLKYVRNMLRLIMTMWLS